MNRLERQVLETIGDDPDSPDVFLDTTAGMAPVRDSLNDAIQEIVMLTGSKVREYFLPLREGQAFYRFSLEGNYFGWVVNAWNSNQRLRLDQTDLGKLAKADPRWMVSAGEPRTYFQVGLDVIGLYPKPSGDTNTIRLTIVEIPAPYTDGTDRVNLRREFERAAVNYAVSEYWAGRGDARQADEYMGFYLEALGLRDRLKDSDKVARLYTEKRPEGTTG